MTPKALLKQKEKKLFLFSRGHPKKKKKLALGSRKALNARVGSTLANTHQLTAIPCGCQCECASERNQRGELQQQVLNYVREKVTHTRSHHTCTYTYTQVHTCLHLFFGVLGACSWHKARCACHNQSEHSAEALAFTADLSGLAAL